MPHPPVVRLAELRDSPLDVADVLAALDAPETGGVAVFIGRVRNHHRGEAVAWLEYSSHPSAADVMAQVCAEVAAAHDVTALGAVHRLGRLEIGEVAVITAVATAHRDQAFEVCRALIDAIKARVPVWKHETLTDGRATWVGVDDAVVAR